MTDARPAEVTVMKTSSQAPAGGKENGVLMTFNVGIIQFGRLSNEDRPGGDENQAEESPFIATTEEELSRSD